VSNFRFKRIVYDSTVSPINVFGTYSFEVQNTGIFGSLLITVDDINISILDDDLEFNIISKESINISPLNPGKSKTVDINFRLSSNNLGSFRRGICSQNQIQVKNEFFVNELILGIEVSNQKSVPINVSDCTILAIRNIELSGQIAQNRVQVGEQFTVSATGSNLDSASDIRWNMGDGTQKTGTEVSHSYSSEGEYSITAGAVDESGNLLDSEQTELSAATFVIQDET
jgi:hypothetical protein